MTLSVVRTRKVWYVLSGALIAACLIVISVFGIRPGIDFTGGTLMEYGVTKPVTTQEVYTALEGVELADPVIQVTDEPSILIRAKDVSEEKHLAIQFALAKSFSEIDELRYDIVGPVIGGELKRSATIGVISVLALIGLYIAWAFRRVSEPVPSWKYAILIIIVAFHDVIIPLGVFAVLGALLGWEVGGAFVAAILTILGYSINDTIVIFDRVRENVIHHAEKSFADIVDRSVRETLARSLYTGTATLLALISIFFFGGATTQPFALALILGIVVGSYSSIFIASPMLVSWYWRQVKA